MNFKTATDALTERITLAEIARACGAAVNSVERARLDATSRHYRQPPPSWQTAIAALARERAAVLLRLAADLEQSAVGE